MIALDTNIIVYAVVDHERSDQARKIVIAAARAKAVLPVQVLAEFANACRRKALIPAEEIASHLSTFSEAFATADTQSADIVKASTLAARYQLQFFDALICTAASGAGASTLLSEDMQDGARIDGLLVLNPFAAANEKKVRQLLAW